MTLLAASPHGTSHLIVDFLWETGIPADGAKKQAWSWRKATGVVILSGFDLTHSFLQERRQVDQRLNVVLAVVVGLVAVFSCKFALFPDEDSVVAPGESKSFSNEDYFDPKQAVPDYLDLMSRVNDLSLFRIGKSEVTALSPWKSLSIKLCRCPTTVLTPPLLPADARQRSAAHPRSKKGRARGASLVSLHPGPAVGAKHRQDDVLLPRSMQFHYAC